METSGEVDELERAAAGQENTARILQQIPSHDDEQVPLLGHPPALYDDGNDRDGYARDFAHLPWYRRPSIEWVLIPYLIMALIFGGIITPKINLIVDLVCRQYYSELHPVAPDYIENPLVVLNNRSDDQCRIPEVSRRVSVFLLLGTLLSGILSAIVSPRLGSLSDLYGRKPIFILCSLGALCGEVVIILVASYQDTIHVDWILLSFVLEGITGSAILAMAMVNTYATDCVSAHRRSMAFSYLHGCTFIGLSIGPILAGYVVKWTGSIVAVFWIMLGSHGCCILFVLFCVPESISKRRREKAREKAARAKTDHHERGPWTRRLRQLNLLEPLKILYLTSPGSTPALRRNLLVLAAMDTIMFGVAMGSVNVLLIYVNYQFGWETFESSRYMTIVNSTRVAFLLVILPAITYLVRDRGSDRAAASSKGVDVFDLRIIQIGMFFETLGWVGYSLVRQGDLFTLFGVIGAAGGISSPALQSALTKHVPSDQTGQLLGVNGLLHALTQIVAPVIFNSIFATTVGKFTQTVFVCLAVTFGVGFIISWFVKPNVYLDTDSAVVSTAEARSDATSME